MKSATNLFTAVAAVLGSASGACAYPAVFDGFTGSFIRTLGLYALLLAVTHATAFAFTRRRASGND